jgi:hypothetical protein
MSVTKNTVVGRTKATDGQAICRRPIEDEKSCAIRFEQRAESVLCFLRDFVRPIADNVPWAGVLKGGENFRATPGVVVAGKLAPMIETPHAHIVKRDKAARQRNRVGVSACGRLGEASQRRIALVTTILIATKYLVFRGEDTKVSADL